MTTSLLRFVPAPPYHASMPGRRTIVWLEPAQADFVRAVARAARLDIVGAGAPIPSQAATVATALSCTTTDDLRAALASAECDCLWIARAGGFGRGESDPVAVAAAIDRGVHVVTSDPVPGSLLSYASSAWSQGTPAERTVPALLPAGQAMRPLREAHETIAALGKVVAGTIQIFSRPDQSSLGALLSSAIDITRSIFGMPETVDAAFVSPAEARPTDAPEELLTGLAGTFTLNFRFPDGRSACALASSEASEWGLNVSIVGERARVHLNDRGIEWIGSGTRRYDLLATPTPIETDASPGVIECADALSRLLDPSIPQPQPQDYAGILAIAHAALLSAKTRSAERPATIQRMLGHDR